MLLQSRGSFIVKDFMGLWEWSDKVNNFIDWAKHNHNLFFYEYTNFSQNNMKQVPIIDLQTAASMVKEGDILLQGGFGMTGNPVHLMHALAEIGTKNLTFIGNNTGEPGLGGGTFAS